MSGVARTVEAYVAALSPDKREIVDAVRRLVKSAAPETTEAFKWAEPVFEANGPFAWVKAHSSHVTFGFWRGAELDKGRGILESSGSKMGHLKLRSEADIDSPVLKSMVKDAVLLNHTLGDPTKTR